MKPSKGSAQVSSLSLALARVAFLPAQGKGEKMGENLGELQFVLLPRALSCTAGSPAVAGSNSLKSVVQAVLCLTPSPKVPWAFFSPLSTICRSFPAINETRRWLSKAPIVRHCSSRAQPLSEERKTAPFLGL